MNEQLSDTYRRLAKVERERDAALEQVAALTKERDDARNELVTEREHALAHVNDLTTKVFAAMEESDSLRAQLLAAQEINDTNLLALANASMFRLTIEVMRKRALDDSNPDTAPLGNRLQSVVAVAENALAVPNPGAPVLAALAKCKAALVKRGLDCKCGGTGKLKRAIPTINIDDGQIGKHEVEINCSIACQDARAALALIAAIGVA